VIAVFKAVETIGKIAICVLQHPMPVRICLRYATSSEFIYLVIIDALRTAMNEPET
jgi:hypothetical protein